MNRPLNRRGERLYLEDVPVAQLVEEFGTPLYAYGRTALRERAERFDAAFGDASHLVTYAIKANMSLAIAHDFARMGLGFDVTSLGELERALRAGGEPDRILYSGVGKRSDEIDRALQVGIRMINLESLEELERVEARARTLETTAPVAFRLNPDVDPKTHPYISTGLRNSKFGIPIEEAGEAYARAKALPHVRVRSFSWDFTRLKTEVLGLFTNLLSLLATDEYPRWTVSIRGRLNQNIKLCPRRFIRG